MISFYINIELTNGKHELYVKCRLIEMDGDLINIVDHRGCLVEQYYPADIKNIKIVCIEDKED